MRITPFGIIIAGIGLFEPFGKDREVGGIGAEIGGGNNFGTLN